MSEKSKSTITSLVAGVAILVAYAIYAAGRFRQGLDGPESLQSWALTMLAFLGIGVVGLILVQILFRIVLAMTIAASERGGDPGRVERILASSMAEDEMDRLVGLRSARVGYVVIGLGFVGLLLVLALGGSAVVGLHVLFGSFAVGSLAAGVVTVVGYERGVGHE